MDISCPHCQSLTVRKNSSIHSGKQKFECLFCHKQFVEDHQNKIIVLRNPLNLCGEFFSV